MSIHHRKVIFAAIAMVASVSAYAQTSGSMPVAQPVAQPAASAPVAVPVGPTTTPQAVSPLLTADQQARLYGKPGVQPGVYKIFSRGYCLDIYYDPDTPTEQLFIHEKSCSGKTPVNFDIMPYPNSNSFTIRSVNYVRNRAAPTYGQKRMIGCATWARNVVFGDPRVDYLACDAANPEHGWRQAGAQDQQFTLKPIPGEPDVYQIVAVVGEEVKCWAAAGTYNTSFVHATLNSVTVAGDPHIYLKPCLPLNDPAQHFKLELVKVGFGGYESDLLNSQGWFDFWDGVHRGVAVASVDIPGNDYSSVATRDDQGGACQASCISDTTCRAWTWIQAGFNGNAKPMCFRKNAIGQPVNAGPANADRIFSGIVRPGSNLAKP